MLKKMHYTLSTGEIRKKRFPRKAVWTLAVALSSIGIAWGASAVPTSTGMPSLQQKYDQKNSELTKDYDQLFAISKPSAQNLLRSQEIAWIKGKRAACGTVAKAQQSAQVLRCLVQHTDQRIVQLRNQEALGSPASMAASSNVQRVRRAYTHENNQLKNSLCYQIENKVKKHPAKVWETYGSLDPWIHVKKTEDETNGASTPNKSKIAKLLRQEFIKQGYSNVSLGNLDTYRMPSIVPPIYMGRVTEGSAVCQYDLFVQLQRDGSYRLLPKPAADTVPCWDVSGYLGAVLGHPAYIELGLVTDTSDNIFARITPWRRNGWGRTCKLTIQFKNKLQLTHRFCGSAVVCDAAAKVAIDVAGEFVDYEKQSIRRSKDADHESGFYFKDDGPLPLAINAHQHFEFPLIGYKGDANSGWDFSFGEDYKVFRINLGVNDYIGVVGYNGVGWRSGDRILFAVYSITDAGKITPLAGFSIDKIPAGLKGMDVIFGRAAIPPKL